jgi:hypothetical protein
MKCDRASFSQEATSKKRPRGPDALAILTIWIPSFCGESVEIKECVERSASLPHFMQERVVELAFSAGCALVGRLFVLADAGTHHLPEWDILFLLKCVRALLCPVVCFAHCENKNLLNRHYLDAAVLESETAQLEEHINVTHAHRKSYSTNAARSSEVVILGS